MPSGFAREACDWSLHGGRPVNFDKQEEGRRDLDDAHSLSEYIVCAFARAHAYVHMCMCACVQHLLIRVNMHVCGAYACQVA